MALRGRLPRYYTLTNNRKLHWHATLVRDPSVYLFINEGDETGNLILGLCFPIGPIATERMHLEPERSSGPSDWVKEQECGELGAATAGSASWNNNNYSLRSRSSASVIL